MTENIAQPLRPVGMLEKWSTVRHNLSFYINVIITARYTTPTSTPLTKPTLYRALTTLLTTHPHLTTTVLNEHTPHPTFARLPTVDLNDLVTTTRLHVPTTSPAAELAELDSILSSQHNTKFHNLGRLPLWRLVLITPHTPDSAGRGVDLAFIYHHALGDGATGLAFHRALLRALNSPSPHGEGEEEVDSVVVPPELPLPPPLEGLVSLSTSMSRMWSLLWSLKSAVVVAAGHWSGAPIQIPLKNVIRTVVFPAGVVAGVVGACRREGTTVTALLQAVLARAFFGVLEEGGEGWQTLSTTAAIDMRRFIPGAGEDTMGVLVCSVPVVHEREATADVWAVAKRCGAVLRRAVEAGTKDTDTGLLKYLSDYEKYFLGKLGTRREHSIEVSNLGVLKNTSEEQGGWGISRAIFSQSASVTGCAVEFSVVSVAGGEMCVCVCVQEGIIEEGVLAGAVRAFEAALVELAGVSE
ncbi:hypothetical protein P167DRAFT_511426 [Morchella conica CCBAS932]|uniref:Alcohol acetyltransferase n=1 Tax=Morchella conica CCBAS932 TaxID=1392247 RepID=A0A3N4KL54_9PEZI|nr:hypothetical protein P167DRAFT_511426 [Morchella conica CCBAS932]